MADFWRNLSDRERMLILGGAVIFALFVLIEGVAAPVMGWRADQRRSLERAQNDYELVAEAAGRAGGQATPSGDLDAPIRNAIAKSASASGVNLIYVNVRPDGAVEANAAQVDPENLMVWLQAVERDYGARVTAADIAREQADPTKVRAQMTFARGGGA